MKRGGPIKRKARMNPVNRKRKAKLHERNFGEEADFIRGYPCDVSGLTPVDAAHMKSRGAGGDKTTLVPLHRTVHESFDNESEARFLERWGRTKDSVRERAAWYNARFHEWKASGVDGLSF